MARRLIKAIFHKETSEDYQVLEGSGTETLYFTNMTVSTQASEYRLRNPVPTLVSSWTPLHTAALGPGLTRLAPGIFLQNTSNVKLMRDIRQLLKNSETNVNAKNASGETPLHVACRTNYTKAVAELINVPDIDVNARDNSGKTPVMASAKYCKEKALRLMLLDPRVELDFRSIEGKGLEDLVEDFSRVHNCLDWIPCSQMIKQVREKRRQWHKQQNGDCQSNNKGVILLRKETNNDISPTDNHHLEDGRQTLECSICLQIMKPPTKIWICQTTHLTCEECKDKLV